MQSLELSKKFLLKKYYTKILGRSPDPYADNLVTIVAELMSMSTLQIVLVKHASNDSQKNN